MAQPVPTHFTPSNQLKNLRYANSIPQLLGIRLAVIYKQHNAYLAPLVHGNAQADRKFASMHTF